MPRVVRIVGPALLLLVALASAVAALQFGGAATPEPIADPGPVVRYGLPLAKLIVNIGAAGTIGALVLASFAMSRDKREFGLALDIAAASAGVWAVASAAAGFFSFMTIYLQPISIDDRFGDLLAQFLTEQELGQSWLYTTLIAAALTVLCFAVRNQTLVAFMAAGSIAGLIPMALQGHAGGTASHDAATSAIWLHIVFAAIWLGGLLTLVISSRTLDKGRIVPLLTRYSTLALLSFVVVAASGYVSAEIRVGTLGNLLTPYGILVLIKVGALGVLGVFGVMQRRYLIGRMTATGARKYFWWLVTAEIAFMGLASGVAAALGRTATPKPEVPATASTGATPAEILTGSPLPPPISFTNLFTLWNFDLIWVLFCAFGVFFYLAGVWRLKKRGDSWPVLRTVLWVAGMALLFYITNGGVNVYEAYLFSAHMLAHMTLGMMVPVLLVPGAPITLALRTIRKRDDGSRGAREWILLATHSKYFDVLSRPLVAAAIFVVSLWIFYYSPLFRWATTDHLGHQWMIIHFLLSGYLFVQSLIGVDPSPHKAPYPLRLLVLLATMAFHAFFGLSLMTGTGLLLADWYGAVGWGISAIDDQQAGGGIAWSVGEIPTVALAIAVAIMWSRSDERDSKRYDRKADRDGDAELEAYNDMLAARATTRRRQ
ncbi:cytochrome c oxidase assembly factor CtaG/putative copper export protein [Conyzicola nivalis]|uniref:Cytochrome c oxidase assembly factor CtaG/putative copper export protein n=1 Tax=Conyzicola nivalis TaxID=1477021 RepID=A0ABV2QRZ7_9MICO